nr:hypothetical protein [Tanacetum cinerariifolium]
MSSRRLNVKHQIGVPVKPVDSDYGPKKLRMRIIWVMNLMPKQGVMGKVLTRTLNEKKNGIADDEETKLNQLWMQAMIKVVIFEYEIVKEAVLCLVEVLSTKERLFCIFIYAENDGRLRRKLWADLIAYKSMSNNNPLVMLGDLNVSFHLDDTLRRFLAKLKIRRNFKIVPMLLKLMIFVVLTFIILGPKAFLIYMQVC